MAKYQPKHMEPKNRVNLRGVAARSVTTVTLAAMLGGQLLSPVSAIAAQADDAQAQHPAVTVGLNLAEKAEADAKLAELQAVLDAAKEKADQKAEALKEPQQAYEAKQQVVEQKQQAATQAKQTVTDTHDAALDQLTAEVNEAKAKLADYQAKIDAANKDLDTAKADEASKKNAADAAKAAADKAASDLAEAQKNADGLTPEKLQAAEAAYDDAKAAADAAAAEVTKAEDAVKSAEGTVTNLTAQKAQAETEAANAAAAVQTAEGNVASAQQAYDAAKAAYDAIAGKGDGSEMTPEEQEALQQQIAAAKQAMDAKKGELDAAVTADANAKAEAEAKQGEVTSLTEQLTAAQAEQTAAQAAYDKAVADNGEASAEVAEKLAAYEQAQKDEADKKAAFEAAQKVVDEKKAAIKAAGETYNATKDAYNAAADVVKGIEQQIADLKAGSSSNNEMLKKGVIGFFEHIQQSDGFTADQKSSASDAIAMIKGTAGGKAQWYEDYVDTDDYAREDNPLSIKALQDALTYMDAVNNIRAANGLSEMNVNLTSMAGSMLNASYSSNVWGHASNSGAGSYMTGAENLAAGSGAYTGSSELDKWGWPFTGWYTSERNTMIEAAKAAGLTAPTDESKMYDFYSENKDALAEHGAAYINIGHYINFINPAYKSFGIGTGAGKDGDRATDKDDGKPSGVTVYQASWSEGDFTVAEFKKLVNDYVESGISDDALQQQIQKLQAQLNEAQAKKGEAFTKFDDASTALYEAQEALTSDMKKAADDAYVAWGKAKSDTLQAKGEYDDAIAANPGAGKVAEAKSKLDAAKKKVEGVQSQLTAATQAKATADAKAADAANALVAAQKAYDDAKKTHDGLVAKDPTAAKAAMDEAKAALDEAKAVKAEADQAKNLADTKVSTLAGQLTDAEGELATKQQALTDAEAEAKEKQGDATTKKAAYDELKGKGDALDAATKADEKAREDRTQANFQLILAQAATTDKQHAADKAVEDAKPARDKVTFLTGIDLESAIEAGTVEGGSDELNAKVKAAHDARLAADEAEEALTKAKAELGEVAPAYIEAKRAYDEAVAERDAAEKALQDYMAEQAKPEQKPGEGDGTGAGVVTGDDEPLDGQQGGKEAAAKNQGSMPQTGDASMAAVAVTAAAGLSMVGVAEILRRRRAQQR